MTVLSAVLKTVARFGIVFGINLLKDSIFVLLDGRMMLCGREPDPDTPVRVNARNVAENLRVVGALGIAGARSCPG